MKKNRTKHSPDFKAKVALAVIKEQETVAAISRRYKVHPNQINKWRQELLEKAVSLFEPKPGANVSGNDGTEREAELLRKIGELVVERDFLSSGLGRFR
jgi:transposase-like protein